MEGEALRVSPNYPALRLSQSPIALRAALAVAALAGMGCMGCMAWQALRNRQALTAARIVGMGGRCSSTEGGPRPRPPAAPWYVPALDFLWNWERGKIGKE